MSTIRLRLTGSQTQADALITTLHGLDQVRRVEEVDDQMRGVRDDSSSSELVDDIGSDLHCLEVQVTGKQNAELIRSLAENSARELGVVLEFVDRF
jgi:hypothetical protein